MKRRILRPTAIGLAGLGLLLPAQSLPAAEGFRLPAIPGFELPLITDVALAAGGTLHGQVVDSAGLALAGVRVELRQNDRTVATTQSGTDGKFAIAGLSGGVFKLSAGPAVGIYRLWAPETAPPAAGQAALIVNDPLVIRGQMSQLGGFLANPLVIAGLVAVAVAVPVAVHEYRVDHKSGS